ncbi:MAG: PaaI family thioesterase [Gammaproteobacteria bacterium]|nr:PaaI family thioesterase [Gammaproteobacteria bacterium]
MSTRNETEMSQARRLAREGGDLSLLRARVPYAAFLDVQVTLDQGVPRFRMPFRRSLIGNTVLPAIHGGAVAGFMENAAILHLLLLLEETRVPKSIDFSIDYLRSANPVDTYAACEVARQGRRVAQVQIRCWQDEEGHPGRQREIAIGRAHFLLTSPSDETGT